MLATFSSRRENQWALKGLSLGCEALLYTPCKGCSSRRQPCPSLSEDIARGNGQLQTHLVRVLQGVHIEGQEEPVEQVVCEHIVEELTVDDQDVIEIVQVVQVLSHQVTQFSPIPVPVKEMFLSVQRSRFGAFGLSRRHM